MVDADEDSGHPRTSHCHHSTRAGSSYSWMGSAVNLVTEGAILSVTAAFDLAGDGFDPADQGLTSPLVSLTRGPPTLTLLFSISLTLINLG